MATAVSIFYICSSLLARDDRYDGISKTTSNLLKVLKLLLHHGCQLSNFYSNPAMPREQTILLHSQSVPLEFFDPRQLYFLLLIYQDGRLAADIARLLYEAGAPLNPLPTPAPTHSWRSWYSEPIGCRTLRIIARHLEMLGAGGREQPGDVERIAWLLHAASEPRSLRECAIGAVRSALEFDFPHKLEQLSGLLVPPSVIGAIRKDTSFDFAQPLPS